MRGLTTKLVLINLTVKLYTAQQAKNLYHWAKLSAEFRITSTQLVPTLLFIGPCIILIVE